MMAFIESQPKDEEGYPDISGISIAGEIVEFTKQDWDEIQLGEFQHDEFAIQYADLIMKKRWSIVFVDDPLFVTSDYPLFVATPEHERYQLGGEGAVVMFPLSPTRILCLDDLNAPRDKYYHLTTVQAEMYNLLTWVNAERFMISSRPIPDVLVEIDRTITAFENDSA